ncbi:hypothetical protein ERJ75_000947500 [Trypanosoma vivax]|uniref:Transmembrane protein n=1 Tax=Trypanosoma vivax (strain Y486) TaxID=1055687 RepID=G0U4H9_TRYVY|nr:hypothetical protein TRVL_00614 [Trypanosoma vivax]KAH8611903.1 hypothetical protein ERJ75_000947500 [Trypanosoma vivax]CCC52343.1 conserved hypothetical protein [Trypanosoma vivax Y486]
MHQFICTYRGQSGHIVIDSEGCSFISERLRTEFPWCLVTDARVMTQHLKGTPMTALEIKIGHNTNAQFQFPVARGKHYLYNFENIVTVYKEIQNSRGRAAVDPCATKGIQSSFNSRNDCDSGIAHCELPPDHAGSARAGNISPSSCHDRGTYGSFVCRDEVLDAKSPNGETLSSRLLSPEGGYGRNPAASVRTQRSCARTNKGDEDDQSVDGGSTHYALNTPFVFQRTHLSDAKSCLSLPSRYQSRSGTQTMPPKKRTDNSSPLVRDPAAKLNTFSGIATTHKYGKLGLHLALLFLAMLIFFYITSGSRSGSQSTSEEKVRNVVSALEKLYVWREIRRKVFLKKHSVDENAKHETGRHSELLGPPPVVTLNDMTAALDGLVERFVGIQRRMASLQLRRAVRRSGEKMPFYSGGGNPSGKAADSTFGSYRTNAVDMTDSDGAMDDGSARQPPRRSMLESVEQDVRAFFSIFLRVGRFVQDLLSGERVHTVERASFFSRLVGWRKSGYGGSDFGVDGEDKLVRYTEQLPNGRVVVENVVSEEAEERGLCLRLTHEMVDVAGLTESVLLQYQDVVLSPLFEAYLHVMQKTTSTSTSSKRSTPFNVAGTWSTAGWDYEMDNATSVSQWSMLMRAIALRRHVFSILHLEPMLPLQNGFDFERCHNQASCFQGSTGTSDRHQRRKRGHAASPEDKIADIISNFVDSTQSSCGLDEVANHSAFVFRNMLNELRYWTEHPEEWQTLVMWRLDNGGSNAAEDASSHIRLQGETRRVFESLPLFKGLLCFVEQPPNIHSPDSVKRREGRKRMNTSHARLSPHPPMLKVGIHVENASTLGGVQWRTGVEEVPRDTPGGCKTSVQRSIVESTKEKGEALSYSSMEDQHSDGSSYGLPTVVVAKDPQAHDSETDFCREPKEAVNEGGDETESEYTSLHDIETAFHRTQLHWGSALELFRVAHSSQGDEWSTVGVSRQEKGHRDEGDAVSWWRWKFREDVEDTDGQNTSIRDENTAHIRRRMLQLFEHVEQRYNSHLFLLSFRSARLLSVLPDAVIQQYLRPQSIFAALCARLLPSSWFVAGSGTRPLFKWFSQMVSFDPVVRRLYKHLLDAPRGDVVDAPWGLLHIMATPHELLSLHGEFCFKLLFLLALFVVMIILFGLYLVW